MTSSAGDRLVDVKFVTSRMGGGCLIRHHGVDVDGVEVDVGERVVNGDVVVEVVVRVVDVC